MDYLSAVSELNYMTQIVIMLYEDNNKVWSPINIDKTKVIQEPPLEFAAPCQNSPVLHIPSVSRSDVGAL